MKHLERHNVDPRFPRRLMGLQEMTRQWIQRLNRKLGHAAWFPWWVRLGLIMLRHHYRVEFQHSKRSESVYLRLTHPQNPQAWAYLRVSQHAPPPGRRKFCDFYASPEADPGGCAKTIQEFLEHKNLKFPVSAGMKAQT